MLLFSASAGSWLTSLSDDRHLPTTPRIPRTKNDLLDSTVGVFVEAAGEVLLSPSLVEPRVGVLAMEDSHGEESVIKIPFEETPAGPI